MSALMEQHARWKQARTRLMDGPPPKPRDLIDVSAKDVFFPMPLWRRITLEVLAAHGLTMAAVCSQSRRKELVVCRHELFYRLRTETDMSYPAIGRRFGKDHTTVIWGVRKHAGREGAIQ